MNENDLLRIEFNQFIKECGLKKGFVSSAIGLAPNTLSIWLNGKFNLSEQKQQDLKDFMISKK